MNQFLLLDFGTTRVKSAIVDLDTGHFSHIISRPAPSANKNGKETGEIPVILLQEQFASICKYYRFTQGIAFAGIMLCCQMHGFAVLTEDGRPATGYITWKDERSLTAVEGETAWDLFNRHFGARFRQLSGMNPRPGFPVFNLLHIARQGDLPKNSLIVSLAELLCLVSGDFAGVTHPTMLAGLGVYDIERKEVASDIVGFISDQAKGTVRFPDVVDEIRCGGYWHSGSGERIPIYVGVGDHQCTVLGAGNIPAKTLSINMGTGSQVSAIDFAAENSKVEQRPYFGGSVLTTITHIPAGRALEEYIGFLGDVAGAVGEPGDVFWRMLAETDPSVALQAKLDFDMGIFSSAWRYHNGGAIRNISEGGFSLKEYLAGLMGSLCRQYRDAAKCIDPYGKLTKCVLSGGIPQKLPQLSVVLSELLQREVSQSGIMDEALIGLRSLALVASGSAKGYREAAEIFDSEQRKAGC